MSTCMAHPPVTQPGPADGLAIWLNTQESDTPKQSQGRGILETLDPMPAFTNRARKRAIALRKHPSGKLHLIITGNCVIKLESRTEHKKVQLWKSAICRRLQVAFGGSLWTQFQCRLLFQAMLNCPEPRWLVPPPYSCGTLEHLTLPHQAALPQAVCTSDP